MLLRKETVHGMLLRQTGSWQSLVGSRGRAFGGLLGDKAPKVGIGSGTPEAEQFLLSEKQ